MVGGTTLASLVVSLWREPKEQFLAAIVGVLVGLLVWLVYSKPSEPSSAPAGSAQAFPLPT